MGGGQQFVYTKSRFLEHSGFDVSVYSVIDGDIVIDGLKKYTNQIRVELKYPPCSFSKSFYRKIVSSLVNEIGNDFDDILIESDGGYESIWAEAIAKQLKAQHIIFNVAEQQNKFYSKSFLDYLLFKYKRNELFGITKDSIRIMFEGYCNITDSEKHMFRATCNNVVNNYDNDTCLELPDADCTIGGIWRTNKEGFIECVDEIIRYITHHPTRRFNVVIIGAGSVENENRVRIKIEQLDNANFIVTGFMYPIPLSVLRQIDVFVSTAGSSRIPIKYGIPSVTVTSAFSEEIGKYELFPLGILNYTTTNTVVPENIGVSLERLLEMVIDEKYCSTHPTLGMENIIFDEENELRDELAKFGSQALIYYDTTAIKPESKLEIAYRFFGKVFGISVLVKVDKLGHILKKRVRK